MFQSTRNPILVVLTIIIITAGFLYLGQNNKEFVPTQVDGAEISNRQGQMLTLSQVEARDLAIALGYVFDQASVDRIKTLFPNSIVFYQSGEPTLSINVANIEMFSPGKMQVLQSGLTRDKAYPVSDAFYHKLQQIANQHRFDLATD